jgi:hypothetical protein
MPKKEEKTVRACCAAKSCKKAQGHEGWKKI